MPDREKVIVVLLDIKTYLLQGKVLCISDNGKSIAQERINGLDNAIALLKEQEAVEPVLDSFLHKRCPSCRALLNGKFCHECGQAVKWDD